MKKISTFYDLSKENVKNNNYAIDYNQINTYKKKKLSSDNREFIDNILKSYEYNEKVNRTELEKIQVL